VAEFAPNETLSELLNDGLVFDATTNNDLTNHLPMALVAKFGLGASLAELSRFATKYQRRLVAVAGPSERLTSASWQRVIGEPAAYPDLVDYFNHEVEGQGIEGTLRSHLGYLVEGVSGAAFHGVIRLAYALDVKAPKRVSTGLAYLAASAMTLGTLENGPTTSDDPEVLLSELAKDQRWRSVSSARKIDAQMKHVASNPAFSHVAASLAIDENTPRRLAAAALKVYASTDDFTALHGVTGLEALSRIRPYVDDVERFDRSSFQALAAAYLSIGAPVVWSSDQLDDMAATTQLDRATVSTRAALSDDEHVAKIVFTSTRLREESGDPLYSAVAERAVRNDETVAEVSSDEAVEC
jgi:hypothetical protein